MDLKEINQKIEEQQKAVEEYPSIDRILDLQNLQKLKEKFLNKKDFIEIKIPLFINPLTKDNLYKNKLSYKHIFDDTYKIKGKKENLINFLQKSYIKNDDNIYELFPILK